MPLEFTINERLAGYAATSVRKDEKVAVVTRELLGPSAPELTDRLEALHRCLFSKIPGLPPPARINDLFVVINNDLSGTAYVDELPLTAAIKAAPPIKAGEAVIHMDIASIESVHVGIDIPKDAAVAIVRSKKHRLSQAQPLSKRPYQPREVLLQRVDDRSNR